MNSLKEVRNFLDGIENRNEGGCGIVALSMYLWLMNRQKYVKDTFVLISYAEAEYINNASAIENNTLDELVAPYHVGFFLNEELIDSSNKPINMDTDEQFFLFVNYKILFALIKNRDAWNDWFNRDKYVPIIEKRLGIELGI